MPSPEVRRARPDDLGAAIEVATTALGWDPQDPNESFFRWKHLDNPAGASPMWVAVDGDDVIGFRSMLRWNFVDAEGDTRPAARAVDTATHPEHHRRGVFRSLTTVAVDELAAEGVGFVFNTPNPASRAGYLRMGWLDAGRLSVRVRPSGPGALLRLARSRVPAAKWSEPVACGVGIEAVVDELPDLLASLPPVAGLTTRRTVDHLRWRYGFEPLHYRVVRDDGGLAIVRLRRRGACRELVLAELLAADRAAARRLGAAIRRTFDVDHVLALSRAPHSLPPMVPAPGLGPRLTLRDLATPSPAPTDLSFSLGDIELF